MKKSNDTIGKNKRKYYNKRINISYIRIKSKKIEIKRIIKKTIEFLYSKLWRELCG